MCNQKTILITGGAGFIGSHVVDELIEKGLNVLVLDNYSSPNSKYENPNCKYYKLNILSPDVENIFKNNNINLVIHLAAQTSVSKSIKEPYFDAEVNILGTIKLLNLCKKYNVTDFFAASSAAVYGNPKYLPIDEKHPCNPISPYGISKLTMEKYIVQSGINHVIYRFANVYGERQSTEGEAGVIAIFNNALENNQDIIINGNGEQTRDFIYVKDIARLIKQVVYSKKRNLIVNVSTKIPNSINNVAKILTQNSKHTSKIMYKEKRKGDISYSVLDNTLLINAFNYSPKTSLNDGLKLMLTKNRLL